MIAGVPSEDVRRAILDAYTKSSLTEMLRYRFDRGLAEEVDTSQSMKGVVFELIELAEREGWAADLIRQAYLYIPRNQALMAVHQKAGFAPAVSAQHAGTDVPAAKSVADGLEKTIKDRLQAFDYAVWREKMAEVEGRVCRVEIGGNPAGTGFLVGPDTVLTNFHVLQSVLTGPTPASSVTCQFDYKVLTDGSRVEGIRVGLHPTNWKLDSSPYSPAELTETPDTPPPTADELDYALVRLARSVGAESSAPKGGADGPRRGWLVVPATPPVFVPKMPLLIAQHPDGKPLKLAVDTESVLGTNAGGTRVRYATNTEEGASGSPVFDFDWNLVALHHLGDPASKLPPAYNQGIPMDKIRARITASGRADALGRGT